MNQVEIDLAATRLKVKDRTINGVRQFSFSIPFEMLHQEMQSRFREIRRLKAQKTAFRVGQNVSAAGAVVLLPFAYPAIGGAILARSLKRKADEHVPPIQKRLYELPHLIREGKLLGNYFDMNERTLREIIGPRDFYISTRGNRLLISSKPFRMRLQTMTHLRDLQGAKAPASTRL